MQRIAAFFALLALVLWAEPAPARPDPSGLLALQRYDRTLNTIGYRLATSAGDLCPDKVPLAGFVLHDLAQYPDSAQADARAAFGFGAEPLVLAVAPGSAAAAADVREGDALLAVDGVAVPPATGGSKSYARMAGLLDRLDSAARDHDLELELELRRGRETRTVHIVPAMGCASRFQTNVSPTVDSLADGNYVEINTGLIDFAGSEDQVAAVVAHELAHNILRHRARLDAKGVSRGVLGQFGRSARLVRQTEEEADRLSVYLLDRAGYPPQAIVDFWGHYRRSHILGFLRAPTHMSETARISMVQAEMARLAAMKAAGQPPRPSFLTGPELPELR